MSEDETLNELLVKLFKDLTEIEGKALIQGEFSDISINDMHIIEAIGTGMPKRMTEIANLMRVTMGTLTTAIISLCKKGYVNRTRDEKDKRVVNITLTEKGIHAFKHHEKFHRDLIEHIKTGLNLSERKVLTEALSKLTDYFLNIYQV